jgi:hypothetical protein
MYNYLSMGIKNDFNSYYFLLTIMSILIHPILNLNQVESRV